MTPWTRLEGSPLWTSAAAGYAANGHAYHGMPHVKALYGHAEALGLAHDLHLDRAILAHDVILDGHGKNELRSADWLDAALGAPDPVARALILTTVDHDPRHPDRRLALLDLMDFSDSWRRRANTRLLRDEAARAKGADFDVTRWVMGTLAYLQGLHGRIRSGLESVTDASERRIWERVATGIAVTMETMPHDYAPHPASGIRRYTPGMEATLHILVETGRSDEDSLEAGRDPSLVKDRDRLHAALVGLKEEGLALRRLEPRRSLWEATDAGRDWVARMRAPAPAWPEPEF
jgi:hypothetical protein